MLGLKLLSTQLKKQAGTVWQEPWKTQKGVQEWNYPNPNRASVWSHDVAAVPR